MPSLNVNGKIREFDAEPDTPLLWVLREQLGLTGTKYGCGVAQCGACTVHIDGAPTRSCVVPVSSVAAGAKIVTIEGLSADGSHPVQKAWVALDVPQCGYCQSGMIMAAAALLKTTPRPTDADIDAAITNICRCGTYNRVRAAIKAAAQGATRRRPGLAIEHLRREVGMSAATVSRRRFLGASAAAGRRPRRRLPHSLRRRSGRAGRRGRRRSTPGSSCNPDDTVVIRIARSEMGQGSLTGLAQLVAEELECDWAKVRTEFPTPGPESRAQARLGQLLDRRQPRHPRLAGVRAQGRRDGARDARAGGGRRMEGSGRRVRRGEQRDHARAVRPPHHVRQGGRSGGEADAASRGRAQEPEGLEDRRQAHRPPRHRGQDDRRAGLRHRSQDARHAERRHPRLPGLRRQGEERRRQGRAREARREEGRARRRLRGRRGGRHVVACEARRRRARDRMGRGSQRAGLERELSPQC